MTNIIDPFSFNFLLHVLYTLSGILVIFLGYKIFIRHEAEKKERNYTGNKGKRPGNWLSISLLLLGAVIIISSIYKYPQNNRDLLKPLNEQISLLHNRDETIFEYVRENRRDVREMLENLKMLNSNLNQTEQRIRNYRENQSQIYSDFQREIDSSKTQFQNLTRRFSTLSTIKDSLLLLKNLNTGVKNYLNEQDELLSRSIRLLESMNNRINLLENTIIVLHRDEINKASEATEQRLDSLDNLLRQFEAELNSN